MQIVIDIDENLYTRLFDNGDTNAVDMLKACVVIRKDIPLNDVLEKIKGYVDHIRNTGMGKKKSLEFIEKFIEGLQAEREE